MSDKPQIRKAKIADLIPDDHNANQGTERGNWALTQSIETYGAGRSVLLDRHGKVIAGNKTSAKFGELGLEDVLIVQTDGKTLVAVQRTDITLDSPEGRGLAIADNRAGELNLNWDFSELLDLHDADQINLNDWWTGEEIDAGMAGNEDASEEDWEKSIGSLSSEGKPPFQAMTFTLHDEQAEQVKAALEKAKSMGAFDSENQNSNGNALARVCEIFLGDS
jgi:hypothetical protein